MAIPGSDAACQYASDAATIKVHKCVSAQSKFPLPSEKVEALLCFCYDGSGVVGPCHIIRDLNA